MIHLPASVRVYLGLTTCDMRKSFDTLHALVREHLEVGPLARECLPRCAAKHCTLPSAQLRRAFNALKAASNRCKVSGDKSFPSFPTFSTKYRAGR
jgi:hypothetical protein